MTCSFNVQYHIKIIEAKIHENEPTRPVLHEAENEAKAKTYQAETTKSGLEAVPRGLNISACLLSAMSSDSNPTAYYYVHHSVAR